MNDSALINELAQLAVRRIGLHLTDVLRERFVAMLTANAKHRGYVKLSDYRDFLASERAESEWGDLARALTCSETFFFRDHGQFDLLRFHLFPELIAKHRNDKTLRIWSAACSSGEEAYSIAILLDMVMPQRDGWDILILGADIDTEAINRAVSGRYRQWSFRMLPDEIKQQYFKLDLLNETSYILDERIRRMVTFRVTNLVDDAYPDSVLHEMDLILCRNVFIYFEDVAVSLVAQKLALTLREGGYLMTAHTELIGHPVHGLESRLFAEGVVYQRRKSIDLPAPAIRRTQNRVGISENSHYSKVASTRVPAQNSKQQNERFSSQQKVSLSNGHDKCATPDYEACHARSPHLNPLPQAGEEANESLREFYVKEADKAGKGTDDLIYAKAMELADKGEFEHATQACLQALKINPLLVDAYYLLAQLAQIECDSNQAIVYLNKALYVDHRFVAAYLELASIYERTDDKARAASLRNSALDIVRNMPPEQMIGKVETTAGELTQWLTQWKE